MLNEYDKLQIGQKTTVTRVYQKKTNKNLVMHHYLQKT
jgi:hypothetical protein